VRRVAPSGHPSQKRHYAFTLVNPNWGTRATRVDVAAIRELDDSWRRHRRIRHLEQEGGGELRVPQHYGILLGKERLMLASPAHGVARLSHAGFIDQTTFDRLKDGPASRDLSVELGAGELRQGLLELPPPPEGNDYFLLVIRHTILPSSASRYEQVGTVVVVSGAT